MLKISTLEENSVKNAFKEVFENEYKILNQVLSAFKFIEK